MNAEFRKLYGSDEGMRVFRAPGRVNLIGEHTDYNMGFVLPVALELAAYTATAPARDGKLRIHSEHRKETREWDAAAVADLRPEGNWTDYPIGVAQGLFHHGYEIHPANLLIRSTVPDGSGLSSSAAIEVSSAFAFLNGRELDPLEIALLCQRAEIGFVGMPCGIMDQYVSVFGREGAAVEIDCRSLKHRYVDLPADITLVAVNSEVKHDLASSAYRERVAECSEAVKLLRGHYPGIESLRDVTPEQLEPVAGELPDKIARRARHIVTEDARVGLFIEASARGDRELMGRLFVESHRSLQFDYEVSCRELDFLVDTAVGIEGVFGSRMTGGGFGGCTVTMMRPDAEAGFRERIAAAYHLGFGITPRIYRCQPSAGAKEMKNLERIPGLV